MSYFRRRILQMLMGTIDDPSAPADEPTFYDWVQMTGNSWNGGYINTGIAVPQDGSRVRLEIGVDPLTFNNGAFFGTTNSTDTNCEGEMSMYTLNQIRLATISKRAECSVNSATLPHNIVAEYTTNSADAPSLSVDGVAASLARASYVPGSGNYMLFGHYVKAWGRVDVYNVKFYYCKIYVDGALVFDGVPAEDDGGAGMYDRVTETMRYNASSSGSLYVGND